MFIDFHELQSGRYQRSFGGCVLHSSHPRTLLDSCDSCDSIKLKHPAFLPFPAVSPCPAYRSLNAPRRHSHPSRLVAISQSTLLTCDTQPPGSRRGVRAIHTHFPSRVIARLIAWLYGALFPTPVGTSEKAASMLQLCSMEDPLFLRRRMDLDSDSALGEHCLLACKARYRFHRESFIAFSNMTVQYICASQDPSHVPLAFPCA